MKKHPCLTKNISASVGTVQCGASVGNSHMARVLLDNQIQRCALGYNGITWYNLTNKIEIKQILSSARDITFSHQEGNQTNDTDDILFWQ